MCRAWTPRFRRRADAKDRNFRTSIAGASMATRVAQQSFYGSLEAARAAISKRYGLATFEDRLTNHHLPWNARHRAHGSPRAQNMTGLRPQQQRSFEGVFRWSRSAGPGRPLCWSSEIARVGPENHSRARPRVLPRSSRIDGWMMRIQRTFPPFLQTNQWRSWRGGGYCVDQCIGAGLRALANSPVFRRCKND